MFGTPLVYCAKSRRLVMLEMVVQTEPLRARYVVIPATLPDGMTMERVDTVKLPSDWRCGFAGDWCCLVRLETQRDTCSAERGAADEPISCSIRCTSSSRAYG